MILAIFHASKTSLHFQAPETSKCLWFPRPADEPWGRIMGKTQTPGANMNKLSFQELSPPSHRPTDNILKGF